MRCIGVSRKFYAKPVSWLEKKFQKLYFLLFLDFGISLISLAIAQI